MTETASLVIKVDSSGAKSASADLDRLTNASGKAEKATDGLARAGRVLAGVFTAAAVARVTGEYIRAADAAANMSAKLRLVTGSVEGAARAQKALYDLSQRNSSDLEATTELYVKLGQSSAELADNSELLLSVTDKVSKALVISGADAASSAAVIRQFSQAMASGALRGDEFISVMEGAPRLARAIADGMGVAVGSLRSLAAEGKLTSEAIIAALENQGATLDREFGEMPLTVSRATQEVRNALLNLVGSADEAAGASAGLAESIQSLARTLESPAVRDGFQTFVSGVVTATSKLAEFLAKGAEVARFWGEEFAARRHGASFDDPVRMEQEAERIQARIDELGAFLSKGRFGRALSGLGRADPYAVGVDPKLGRAGGNMVENAKRELEILLARLNELRQAISDFYNKPRPTVTVPDVPAPSASLIPAALGGSDKKAKLTDEQRELARLQDSYESYLEQLKQANALAWDTSEVAEANYRIQRDGLDKINPKLAEQIRLEAQRRDELERSKEQWDQIERDYQMLTGVWEDIRRDQAKASDSMSEYAKQAARNMQTHFADFLFDPFKDGISGMVQGFADALRRMAAEAAAAKIFEGIGAWGQANAGAGGWVGKLAGFVGLLGGQRAAGGPMQAGQGYIVGDGGRPELFVPNQSGTLYPMGKGTGSQPPAPALHVIVKNEGNQQMQADSSDVRFDGERWVANVVLKTIASGTADSAMQGRFGVRPRGYANG